VRESTREVGGRWTGDYGTGRLSGGRRSIQVLAVDLSLDKAH
jgi:hypothetical protein